MADGPISPDLAAAAGAAINVVGAVGGGAEAVLVAGDAARIVTGHGHEATTAIGKVANGALNGGNEPGHPLQPAPSDKPVESDKDTITVRRTEFTSDMVGLPATDKRGGKREKGVTPSETITFNKEIVNGFSGFSESYVQDLIRLYDQPSDYPDRFANRYEQMKAEQGTTDVRYFDDEYMLHFFSDKDPKTGLLSVKAPDQIAAQLQKRPEMMKHLMIIEDRYARDILAAMGARAELVGAGNRTDLGRIYDRIPLFDQGRLRRVTNKVADSWNSRNSQGRGEPGNTRGQNITDAAARVAAAAGTGAAILATSNMLKGITSGHFIGAEAIAAAGTGAAVGLGLAGAYGVAQRLQREGVVLDITEDQSLISASASTGELSRAKYFIGIDPEMPDRSTNFDKVRQRAIQLIYHRIDYMRTLGVPAENLDALSDQRLYVNSQRPENNFAITSRNVNDRFERMGGFNPPGATPEERIENQRTILRRAEEEELVKQYEKLLAKETADDPENDPRKILERLDSQIDARSEKGTLVTERTKKATTERGLLTTDKNALEADIPTLETYATSAKEKIAAAEKAQADLDRERTAIVGPGGIHYTDVDSAITAIQNTLSAHTPITDTILIRDKEGRPLPAISPIQTQRDNLLASTIALRAGLMAAIPVNPKTGQHNKADVDSVEDRVREAKREGDEKINAQEARLIDAIQKLNDLRASSETNNIAVSDSTAATISTYEKAYADIYTLLSTAAGGPIILNPNFDTALNDINTAFTTSSAAVAAGTPGAVVVGWPEGENKDPQRRATLRKALAEQKRQTALTATGLDVAFKDVVDNPAVAQRISADQLRSMSLSQLNALAVSLGAPTGPLVDAQKYAIAQVTTLQSAIKDELASILATDTALERNIKSVDVSAERDQLELVKGIYEATGKISARAMLATTIPEKRDRLTNASKINSATAQRENFTQAEVASNLPRNILEILNILTNYQASKDRDGDFNKIWTRIGGNPEMLMRFLNNAYGESLGGNPTTSPNVFATRLSTSIRNGGLNTPRFNRNTSDLITQFVRWSSII